MAHKLVLTCWCVLTCSLTLRFLLEYFYHPYKMFFHWFISKDFIWQRHYVWYCHFSSGCQKYNFKHCKINWKTGSDSNNLFSQSKYWHKNRYKYSQELIRRRKLHLSVQANGSTVEQQMALPMESPTKNIAINELLFKKMTRGIRFFILLVDSVAIVRYQILIEKNSLQNVFLYEIQ